MNQALRSTRLPQKKNKKKRLVEILKADNINLFPSVPKKIEVSMLITHTDFLHFWRNTIMNIDLLIL